MNILDFTAADLVNYVESQFKAVVDSDYEDDDRAYRQKSDHCSTCRSSYHI